MKEGKPIRISYSIRWGRPRNRKIKGHPKRELRRQRAAERLAAGCPIENTRQYRLKQTATA